MRGRQGRGQERKSVGTSEQAQVKACGGNGSQARGLVLLWRAKVCCKVNRQSLARVGRGRQRKASPPTFVLGPSPCSRPPPPPPPPRGHCPTAVLSLPYQDFPSYSNQLTNVLN